MAVHQRVGIKLPGEPPVFFDTAPHGSITGRRKHDLREHQSGRLAMRVDVGRVGQTWRVRILVTPGEPGVTEFSPNAAGHYLEDLAGRTDMRLRVSRCTDGESKPRVGVQLGGVESVAWELVDRPDGPGKFERLQIIASQSRVMAADDREADKRPETP